MLVVDIFRAVATKLFIAMQPLYFYRDRIYRLKSDEYVTMSVKKDQLVKIIQACEEFMQLLSDKEYLIQYVNTLGRIHGILEDENMFLHRPEEYPLESRLQAVIMEMESAVVSLKHLRNSMGDDK